MGVNCVVCGCKEIFTRGGRVSFHRFPRDEPRRSVWEALVRPNGGFKANNSSKVCSKHFTEECYDRMKLGGTWLNKTAVPTIFDFSQVPYKRPYSRKEKPGNKGSSYETSIKREPDTSVITCNSAIEEKIICMETTKKKKRSASRPYKRNKSAKAHRWRRIAAQTLVERPRKRPCITQMENEIENVEPKQPAPVAPSDVTVQEDSIASAEVIEQEDSTASSELTEQDDSIASDDITNDSPAGPIHIKTLKPPYVMRQAKMFVNVAFFIKSLQKLNNHGGDGCNLSDMYITGEPIRDCNVGVELSCRVCLTSGVAWMQDPGREVKEPNPTATKKKTPVYQLFTKDGEKMIDDIIDAHSPPRKKRKARNRRNPTPPPSPPAQQPRSLAPLSRPILVPQTNTYHQIWTASPSPTINPYYITPQSNNLYPGNASNIDTPSSTAAIAIKQEPKENSSSFSHQLPLSSSQPVAVQLLFSVEPSPNSNEVDESATSAPGGDFRDSSMICTESGQTAVNSESVLPEVMSAEVMPVDLNLVKKEVDDYSLSMEVNNVPSVCIVPKSVTSLNPSDTAINETSKVSTPVKSNSVVPKTETNTTEIDEKTFIPVSDIGSLSRLHTFVKSLEF